ncbi:MAG: hypothetical protein F6K35_21335, partial [Okeania sp. SIO2H7]|nr:hypothetical protein [Okeania sp. SIO2H7]
MHKSNTKSTAQLQHQNNGQKSTNFCPRHIGPASDAIQKMLTVLSVSSLDDLIDKTVPQVIRYQKPLNLPKSLSETAALAQIKEIASKNQVFRSFIGMGYYDCITPPVILRNILENPGWYTAYTPYQAEIAQGRMEALLNFQTMITDLTGLEIANASLHCLCLPQCIGILLDWPSSPRILWKVVREKSGSQVKLALLIGFLLTEGERGSKLC